MRSIKTVFITGASSGIGRACAEIFAKNNYSLILNARRKNILDEICHDLQKTYNTEILPLPFDVSNYTQVNEQIKNIPPQWRNIDVLVNNAGLALGKEPISEGDPKDWDKVIDTNIKGLMYVSREVIPILTEKKSGHIINIGSIASKDVYSGGNVYCATKFAVDALTQSMRYELLQYNIKVTAIHPGRTQTEFSTVRFKGDKNKAKEPYAGFRPMDPCDVAETIYYIASLPKHVNINELIIVPSAQASSTCFNRVL
ncbi:MAG: SDR family NAD(P)-dependent oxidoreductase [Solitalea-like symbiont of Tyrophagus putrescentiae]